ncbi:hypothetical protein A2U01_0061296, partial [Trifolium medium]|nr:hypothetical protein [Trifolium medium]
MTATTIAISDLRVRETDDEEAYNE